MRRSKQVSLEIDMDQGRRVARRVLGAWIEFDGRTATGPDRVGRRALFNTPRPIEPCLRIGWTIGVITALVFAFLFCLSQPTFGQHKVLYSTYLGGDDVSWASGVEVDGAGNMTVVGVTRSQALRVTENALEKKLVGSASTFLQVISPGGNLVYSTYLNNTRDVIHKVDAEGHIYLTGLISDVERIQPSKDPSPPFFFTTNAFQTRTGIRFVMKLDVKRGRIIYASRMGGNFRDETRMDVDDSGSVYLAGTTYLRDFPTTSNSLNRTFPQTALGRNFVAKLNPSGTALVYSTFLETGDGFRISDLKVDRSGNVYLVGGGGYFSQSERAVFPTTPNAVQPLFRTNYKNQYHGVNGFLIKLNNAGSRILYASYLGGSYSRCTSIALDQNNSVYIAGVTSSDGFQTTNGVLQKKFLGGTTNSFVVKLDESLTAFKYSTLFSSEAEFKVDSRVLFGRKFKRTTISKIAVDNYGRLFVVGGSNSNDLPVTRNALRRKWSGASLNERFSLDSLPLDSFLSVLTPEGSQLVYSTFLFGSKNYVGQIRLDLALDDQGAAYIAGEVGSSGLEPTPDAVQMRSNDKVGFLIKIQLPNS